MLLKVVRVALLLNLCTQYLHMHQFGTLMRAGISANSFLNPLQSEFVISREFVGCSQIGSRRVMVWSFLFQRLKQRDRFVVPAQEDESNGIIISIRKITFSPELSFHFRAFNGHVSFARVPDLPECYIGSSYFMTIQRRRGKRVEARPQRLGSQADENHC